MLSVELLQVAEEEVVESSPNKLGDIYTFVSKGCFSRAITPLKKKNLKRYARKFICEEGKLYYVGARKEEKREVVIEAERKRQIFLDCHFNDVGQHLGQKKTVHRIQSRYYWLGIIRDVVDWIKLCETCQHAERSKSLSRTVRPIKVDAPWDIIGVDILGPFPQTLQGNTHALSLIDYFSKWPEAFPLQKTDALSVARCLSKCIHRFGAPKTIVCARNADFCSEVSGVLCEKWSIVQTVSPLDQPHLNPLHDCSAPLLKEAVEQMVSEKLHQWDDFLDSVLFLLRTTVNPTTKFTPYTLMFNRTHTSPNQTSCVSLSSDDQDTDLKACAYLSIIKEQQNSIKHLVQENMKAAYKQEKKRNTKRRNHHINPAMSESLFGQTEPQSAKKLQRDSVFLSFPIETVLATVQSGSESDVKTELEYDLEETMQ